MYDIAIIGGGPAGITAGIYAARYKLNTVMVSPSIGGWASKAHRIENLPSHVSIMGKELKKLYTEHVRANEIDFKQENVTAIAKTETGFWVKTNPGEYEAKFLVYATGTKKRKMNVPGEDEFLGKGVCLCATCDAPFFRGKDVAVIGGNDSGTTAALLCAEYAAHVTIVEMMDHLPTEPIWMEQIEKHPRIDVITGDTVKAITGRNVVEKVVLNTGKELTVSGVFIEVGSIPDTELIKALEPKTDKWGHLNVSSSQETSIAGLYAAGDITSNSNYMRQIVAAQAEGAICAQAIYKRIMKGL